MEPEPEPLTFSFNVSAVSPAVLFNGLIIIANIPPTIFNVFVVIFNVLVIVFNTPITALHGLITAVDILVKFSILKVLVSFHGLETIFSVLTNVHLRFRAMISICA